MREHNVTSCLLRLMMSMLLDYVSNRTLFWKIVPLRCTPAFRRTFYMTKLKKSHDKVSFCLKPSTVSKGSKMSNSTLKELQELLNVILHSLISKAATPCSGNTANSWFFMKLSKAALKSIKRWCVLSCFSRMSVRIWRSVKICPMVSVLMSCFSRSHIMPVRIFLYAISRSLIPL